MTQATAVRFFSEEVRDRADRIRVERRRRQLVTQYSTASSGGAAIERAAELVSLLELAWVKSGDDGADPQEASDFMRLGELAAEAVTKLGLPPSTATAVLPFDTAVDGLLSKSGAEA